jgi:hypothetical protein
MRMGYRRRRESEKSTAASYFVVFAVVIVTFPLLLAAVELLFAPTGVEIWHSRGRCLLRWVSGANLGGYYLQLVLALLAFGSALIAKRLEFVQRWRILVYGSAAGVLSCLIILITVRGEAPGLEFLPEIKSCRAPLDSDALSQLEGEFFRYSVAAIIWYCGIVATQFGIELPKFSNHDQERDKG